MKIVFATNNEHKLAEARRIAGGDFTILSLSDIGCHADLPETQPTIEGNSLQKAAYVKEHFGYDCFSDDTGLFVDALHGAPGVFSARYAGPECSPDQNITKLLAEMEGIDNRDARFRTVVTLVSDRDLPGSNIHGNLHAIQFEGAVEGSIAPERSGNGGFGYDPIFIAKENGISFADLLPEEKNAISHRGRALRKLFDYLKK